MSRIVVTGASGFVGSALVRRLQESGLHSLTLVDQSFEHAPSPGIRQVKGSLVETTVVEDALSDHPDIVFHLASIPGALAEREHAFGYQVNLQSTLALAHRLNEQGRGEGRVPRMVFASSVAVYGPLGSADVHEHQLAVPAISYGAHKLMAEIELADLSRRGGIDAVSLRLPGIVARPPSESGHGSAFMSLVMHKLAAGEHYVSPVPPQASAWWMSLPCCIDNLMHAATMSTAFASSTRTWQLPVLHLTMAEVVEALARRFGATCPQLVSYQPDEGTTALFGRFPALHTPVSTASGFRHDGDADRLVEAALAPFA